MQRASDDTPSRWLRFLIWLWPTRARVIVVLALTMAIWGATDVRWRATVDLNNTGLHKTDFTVYTEAGAAFFDGRDPYSVTNVRGWGYLYPPLFALLVAPLHALHPQTQAMVWFVLSVLMAWGCYRECVRIARVVLPDEPECGSFGPLPNWLGIAALLAVTLATLNCLQRGQVGVAKVYLLLLGFRMLMESRTVTRSFLAGSILALPIVLKITPILPVTFLVCERFVAAWNSTARPAALRNLGGGISGIAMGLVVCMFLLPAALVGWRANLDHLQTWRSKVTARAEGTLEDEFAGDGTSSRNQSFTNAVHKFGNWADHVLAGGPNDQGPEQLRLGGHGLLMDAPIVNSILWVARFAAACLLAWVGYRMARDQDRMGQAAAFGLACVSTLVLAPIARGHYYVLLLPAVLFVSAWLWVRRRTWLAVVFVVAPGLLVLAHYAMMGMAGRVGLLGIGTTLWYTAACVALLRVRSRAATPAESAHPSAKQPMTVFFRRIAARQIATLSIAGAGGLTDRAPSCRGDLFEPAVDGFRSS